MVIKSVLRELLEFNKPFDEILSTLERFESGSVPLVLLERRHVASILRRYSDGDLDRLGLERWANLILARNDIGYNSDAVIREYLLYLAIPANTQLTREWADKSAVALIEGPTAKAVEAAARVLHHEALRHGWWGEYKKSYDELAATDSIGKYEFDGLVERMLVAAMQAKG